ncbi:hypothetical protein GCM10008983_17180 [Lentibacillus halophilus]|uniref:Uncharacterized protein n=1 Tax=Lentibacillus halophilus TaxID=295065 RepID=A0ABP3J3R6_9BACI
MLVLIVGVICAFLSVLSAIYAIRAIIDEQYKHNFSILVFLSAIFAAGAYLISLITN